MTSKLVTQLTERSASTAFDGLQDIHVDSELTRKLLLGVFERKVPKISTRQTLYNQSSSGKEKNDGSS